jgi:hypothetical protein
MRRFGFACTLAGLATVLVSGTTVAHEGFHLEGWIWLVPFVCGLVLGVMFIVLIYSVYRELRQPQ